jgi:4-hydroxybenzoyl-CoA thioesterase
VFLHERAIRFEEVDAAHIVFFPRFLAYCHEAMEAMLAPLPGGYARLVLDRKIGLPAVHVEMDFTEPLRFGDVACIAVTVERLGKSSCTFRYDLSRKADSAKIASVQHVCAVSDLVTLRAVPIPEDVREVLSAHLPA